MAVIASDPEDDDEEIEAASAFVDLQKAFLLFFFFFSRFRFISIKKRRHTEGERDKKRVFLAKRAIAAAAAAAVLLLFIFSDVLRQNNEFREGFHKREIFAWHIFLRNSPCRSHSTTVHSLDRQWIVRLWANFFEADIFVEKEWFQEHHLFMVKISYHMKYEERDTLGIPERIWNCVQVILAYNCVAKDIF